MNEGGTARNGPLYERGFFYLALFVKFVAFVRKKSAFGFFTVIRTKNSKKKKSEQTGKEHESKGYCVCMLHTSKATMYAKTAFYFDKRGVCDEQEVCGENYRDG
ncbi:hypothetical protein ACQCT5_00310 [Sutcliffiella halmapala]